MLSVGQSQKVHYFLQWPDKENIMTDPFDVVYADPIFEAIMIAFDASVPAEQQAERAWSVLEKTRAAVLGASIAGWQVEKAQFVDNVFYLLPPEEAGISVGQAFGMKYALEQEPGLEFVDLSFETNADNVYLPVAEEEALAETALFAPEDVTALEVVLDCAQDEDDPEWGRKMIKVQEAWDYSLAEGNPAQGAGIRIGHIDSGIRVHPEMAETQIRTDLQYDTITKGGTFTASGAHGLGTSSVLASSEARPLQPPFVTGVAPQAEILPIRVVRDGPPVFVDPIFRIGQKRVIDAVNYAVANNCHVISMSLGGLFFFGLHYFIRRAVQEHNIIVVAAAGNYSHEVVWPARYPEVIAVAGCTADCTIWFHSNAGPQVDVTAPGKNVFRAYYDDAADQDVVEKGSGTSYATPHVSGVAALWLAHHGRQFLLNKYQGPHPVYLYQVFRKVLTENCGPKPAGHGGEFGCGIVDAESVLKADLPTYDDMVQEIAALETAAAIEAVVPDPAAPYTEMFRFVEQEEVRARLALLLGVPESELDSALARISEEELAFLLRSQPELRRFMAHGPGVAPEMEAAPEGVISWHDKLMAQSMSAQLQQQISPAGAGE
jgi:thermitase